MSEPMEANSSDPPQGRNSFHNISTNTNKIKTEPIMRPLHVSAFINIANQRKKRLDFQRQAENQITLDSFSESLNEIQQPVSCDTDDENNDKENIHLYELEPSVLEEDSIISDLEESLPNWDLVTPMKRTTHPNIINDSGYNTTSSKTTFTSSETENFNKLLFPEYKTPSGINFLSTINEVPKQKVLFTYTPSHQIIKPRETISTQNNNKLQPPVFNKPQQTTSSFNNIVKNAPQMCNKNTQVNNTTNDQLDRITVNEKVYYKFNKIGKGGSSDVYLCYDPTDKIQRAIKVVDLSQGDEASAGYKNEVKILQQLQKSDRIIRMFSFEIVEAQKRLYMVLEMGGKDISQILKEFAVNPKPLPVYIILYYWMEMLHCVRDIHEQGIIHSDLKPANFLVAEGGIKLIDFGIASRVQTDMTSVFKTSAVGSLNYISPEAMQCDDVNSKFKIKFKSDVWSLGCILYQLVYKKAPFHHITNMAMKVHTITNKNHKIEYPPAEWVPQKILHTIKSCLQFQVNLRPSVANILQDYENWNLA